MIGWFDRLPTVLQHAIIAATALISLALLNWLQATYTTWNLAGPVNDIIAMLVPVAIGYVTPWTTAFGVGSKTVTVAPTPEPPVGPAAPDAAVDAAPATLADPAAPVTPAEGQ